MFLFCGRRWLIFRRTHNSGLERRFRSAGPLKWRGSSHRCAFIIINCHLISTYLARTILYHLSLILRSVFLKLLSWLQRMLLCCIPRRGSPISSLLRIRWFWMCSSPPLLRSVLFEGNFVIDAKHFLANTPISIQWSDTIFGLIALTVLFFACLGDCYSLDTLFGHCVKP